MHRYQLQTKKNVSLNRFVSAGIAREGALVNIDGGYASIFPWPELGDQPLREQLESLRSDFLTPLTQQAIFFAKIDADARQKKTSLFKDL